MAGIVDFIEENYEELLAFAVKLNGNWADGEDVLQTVAVKICAKQDELRDIANFKSYLMICIRNATLNLNRTKAKQHTADQDFERLKNVLPDPDAAHAFAFAEWAESLDGLLKAFDEKYRRAFIAYYVEQEPLGDVAASLGLTKRRTFKIFENMRRYLKRHDRHLFIQLSVLLSM